MVEILNVVKPFLQGWGDVDSSDKRKFIFPAKRNRNGLAEPTSVRIGTGIVYEYHKLRIGIGIIFVIWEVFAKFTNT